MMSPKSDKLAGKGRAPTAGRKHRLEPGRSLASPAKRSGAPDISLFYGGDKIKVNTTPTT